MNHTRTAIQTADLIAKKQISPVEVTAEYLQFIENTKSKVTKLAQGLPVGGEIESLDDGTLFSAFKNRSKLNSG